MSDLFFAWGRNFTDSDKEKCSKTIQRMVNLAHITRQRGILSLKQQACGEQNTFLKHALRLLIDSVEPEFMKSILQSLIIADNCWGSELLDRFIVLEGVMCIQKGVHPSLINTRLYSLLGLKYYDAMKSLENLEHSDINSLPPEIRGE